MEPKEAAMPVKGSGIQTFEDLRARCVVSELTDCWRWNGAMSAGHPRIWMFDPAHMKFCACSGPRAVAILKRKRMPKGHRAWMTCLRKDCVNPDHCKTGTVAEWGAWMAAHGRMKNNPRRKAAVRRVWDERLPQHREAARLVREADPAETGRALAARLGLSDKVISRMRNGRSWQEAPGPFAGLGAR